MIALIGWIGRFLLIMFVVRAVMSLLAPSTPRRSAPSGGGQRPRGPFPGNGPFPGAGGPVPPRQPPPERVGGQLVKCEQCGTYVPQASAIQALRNSTIQHFCSVKCRDEFAAAHPS